MPREIKRSFANTLKIMQPRITRIDTNRESRRICCRCHAYFDNTLRSDFLSSVSVYLRIFGLTGGLRKERKRPVPKQARGACAIGTSSQISDVPPATFRGKP